MVASYEIRPEEFYIQEKKNFKRNYLENNRIKIEFNSNNYSLYLTKDITLQIVHG